MEFVRPENWVVVLVGMIMMITLAQMLIVYALSDSANPPEGQGMFTAYFLIALIGWTGMAMSRGAQSDMTANAGAAASIVTSYILYLAAAQRSGETQGRLALGALCLLGVLNIFFVKLQHTFVVPTILSMTCYIATAILFARRGFRQRNVGDAIMTIAALLLISSTPASLYQYFVHHDTALAYTIALGARSWACTLISLGFLASVLIDYQQHLSHLATQDPLTQLLNRRGLQDTLQVALAKASRQALDIAAIAIDIDHFKKINDTFGHQSGDEVLRRVASILRQQCRASDVVARTGGEEFLVVLPDANLESAHLLAQRLHQAIGDTSLEVGQYRIPVTISLGLATAHGNTSLDSLIQEADKALYIGKQNGRNRVATIEKKPIHIGSVEAGKPSNA